MKRLLIAVAMLLCGATASAAVTFGASVTNANGSLSTTLSWSAPGASGCVASGSPAWTGAKPASGSLALPAITLSGTYALTLTCTTPGNAATFLDFTPPTTNTDGTPLTNLAGYKALYGSSPASLTIVKSFTLAQVTAAPGGAGKSTVSLGDLAVGSYSFVLRAVNAAGVESDDSALATKTVTAATSESASVSLTVNPIPSVVIGPTVR